MACCFARAVCQDRPMARTWLSIQIELIDGGGQTLWPRPGRIFAAARSHTFAQLATASDDAFARWDRAHLHMFDLGDDWAHLCTVADQRIDPQDTLGITPDRPLPYWGWGSIPDQYGRRWDSDDGETRQPADPQLTDLPALHPGWGQRLR